MKEFHAEDVFHDRTHEVPLLEDIVLNPDHVAEYLRKHPDFFIDYENLLPDLALPHHTGEHAISLVERQVSVLRARNRDVRSRLNRLLEVARDNDRLFQKTQKLVLAVLEQRTADDIVTAVEASLRDDYRVDVCRLLLLSDTEQQAAQQQIGTLLNNRQPLCGHLRPQEAAYLFAQASQPVRSAAVVVITRPHAPADEQPLAVLAIGSFDADHYQAGMGTLFLSYIAEVLSRTLARCDAGTH